MYCCIAYVLRMIVPRKTHCHKRHAVDIASLK